MTNFYTLEVAGLTRELPICPVNENLDIAGFVMFSDVELTIECAKELIKKCPECDVILTAESKGIPLSYEMARQLGIRYVVARKSLKAYMQEPVAVKVKSITTANEQVLYLDKYDFELLENKRVLIVDDVISTGESLLALEKILQNCSGKIVGRAAVLAEGDAIGRDDITYLQELPLFFK